MSAARIVSHYKETQWEPVTHPGPLTPCVHILPLTPLAMVALGTAGKV